MGKSLLILVIIFAVLPVPIHPHPNSRLSQHISTSAPPNPSMLLVTTHLAIRSQAPSSPLYVEYLTMNRCERAEARAP